MRILPNGSVGIGIASPGYSLDVNSTIGAATSFVRKTPSSSVAFSVPGTGLTSTDYNYILSGGNDTGNKLVVFVNGSTRTADGGASNVTIRNDVGSLILGNATYPTLIYGRVGIGLAAPERVLHVYSAATTGSGPFVVDQYAATGFTDTVTLFRTAQAATSACNMMTIQAASGSTNLFYVRADGYVWAKDDITAFSDARVKTNVTKIDSALDKVSQINGYTFNRVDSTEQKRSAGVIAQEVQKVLPEVVHEDKDGYLSVAYGNLTALLIEALKEERAAREALTRIICSLEERIKNLEK
jgi:hypothetical protein